MPHYDEAFFAEPLKVVEGLVKGAKAEALVLVTLYSPFMWARRVAGDARLTQHILESPSQVEQGMERITESVRTFMRACVRLGVDGFYASTQGGEAHRFTDVHLFEQFVKPYDLSIMQEIDQTCLFNILHVCDYQGSYDDLTRFLDYPGHVVDKPLASRGSTFIAPRGSDTVQPTPLYGGYGAVGGYCHGSEAEVKLAAAHVLASAPTRFILAADCTVPSATPWANLRTAITAAHELDDRPGGRVIRSDSSAISPSANGIVSHRSAITWVARLEDRPLQTAKLKTNDY